MSKLVVTIIKKPQCALSNELSLDAIPFFVKDTYSDIFDCGEEKTPESDPRG